MAFLAADKVAGNIMVFSVASAKAWKRACGLLSSVGCVLSFSVLAACFTVMFHQAFPFTRQTDNLFTSAFLIGAAAPVLIYLVLSCLLSKSLNKKSLWWLVFACGFAVGLASFALIATAPQLQYSPVAGLCVGASLTLAVFCWARAFCGFQPTELIAWLPLILLMSSTWMFVLLSLGELANIIILMLSMLMSMTISYAQNFAAQQKDFAASEQLSSGSIFALNWVLPASSDLAEKPTRNGPVKRIAAIIVLIACISALREAIRQLSRNSLYENPDYTYFLLSIFILLGFLTAIGYFLWRISGAKRFITRCLLPAALLAVLLALAWFTKALPIRYTVVLSGNAAFFIALNACLIVYARTSGVSSMMSLCLGQTGMIVGIVTSSLYKPILDLELLGIEVKSVALFGTTLLSGVVLLVVLNAAGETLKSRVVKKTQATPAARASHTNAGHTTNICRQAVEMSLTKRELDIARQLAKGYSTQHIAHEYHLSASTVHNHRSAIYRKLGIHNRDDLIALFRKA